MRVPDFRAVGFDIDYKIEVDHETNIIGTSMGGVLAILAAEEFKYQASKYSNTVVFGTSLRGDISTCCVGS